MSAPRTNRLFDLIQTLRDGRLHRAQDLAAQHAVTARTIWRDIEVLRATGLAIEGERGLGYVMRMPLTLPQLMLSAAEMEALRAGLRTVATSADNPLAAGARSLAAKIAAITPMGTDPSDIFSAKPARTTHPLPFIPILRRAIRARMRIAITHVTAQNITQHSDMRPLFLDLKSKIWTLTAYCEAARDFVVLRLDRVQEVTQTGEVFMREPGCEWADFRARQIPAQPSI